MNELTSEKKVRISYFVSNALLSDLKNNMIQNGYDLKSKSKWIAEALQDLLAMNNYRELILLSEQMEGFSKLDYICIEKSLKKIIDSAIINVRTVYPVIEGVQSKILRTAILQRLIKA